MDYTHQVQKRSNSSRRTNSRRCGREQGQTQVEDLTMERGADYCMNIKYQYSDIDSNHSHRTIVYISRVKQTYPSRSSYSRFRNESWWEITKKNKFWYQDGAGISRDDKIDACEDLRRFLVGLPGQRNSTAIIPDRLFFSFLSCFGLFPKPLSLTLFLGQIVRRGEHKG